MMMISSSIYECRFQFNFITMMKIQNKPPWHAWKKNIFGFPIKSGHFSALNDFQTSLMGRDSPSVPYTPPSDPWLSMNKTKQSDCLWCSHLRASSNISLIPWKKINPVKTRFNIWKECGKWDVFLNTIFVSSHMYPENPEETQVIVGSMNIIIIIMSSTPVSSSYEDIGYISDIARNRTHDLFHPKREPIPLGHSDGCYRNSRGLDL